jgi:hypothetical protein
MKTLISLASVAACGVILAGCATAGYQKANTTSTSIREAAQGIDNTLGPLDAVVATLSDLMTNPSQDITPQFRKFDAAVTNLDSLANDVRNHEAAMREQGAAYFEKWDAELAKIHNDEMQSLSLDRKNAMASRFEKVRLSYTLTNANFAPFMSNLKDIRTALAMDLTAAGLASVKGLAGKANDQVLPLRASLIRLSAEFRNLGVSLSTTTLPKAD